MRRELGEDATLLAGGTSVMVAAKLGLAELEQVIALGDVRELYGISGDAVKGLRFGAMTTIREIETSHPVREAAPGIAAAAHEVATVRIRNQATIGGNLVHADPNQDLPPMLMVYDAVAHLSGEAGRREVPVADLFVDFFETVVQSDEILVSVRVPPAPADFRAGYLKFLPRTRDDYCTIAVAAGLRITDGVFRNVRIAIAGGAATPRRCVSAATSLEGQAADESAIAAAGDLVLESVDPISDGRGSARYKSEMARVCARRLLQSLVSEARS